MVFDIFSKRAKRQSGVDDVYQYKELPRKTKIQVIHLWKRAIGNGEEYTDSRKTYIQLCNILREEYGLFNLS